MWLQNCNGQIRNFNTPYTTLGNCVNTVDSSNIGQLAYALGANTGSATPGANHAVTAYTEGNPGANAVEFQTVDNLPLASASGRFLTFSVDTAAVNCNVSAPEYQFAFLNESGAATNVGGVINACSSASTVDVPAYGTLPARAINVGTYTSNGSLLFDGSSLGIRMTNANGSGLGNDAAFDNIRILDVTPQLDKVFSPTTIETGQTSTLTFTVTNTDELAAKNGWSFTDNLPAGLTLASPTAAATTCPSGAVTADAGGTTVGVTGNLSGGMASCTVTVNVTGVSAGAYTNGPGNVTETGLNPPGDTTLTINPPVVTCTTDPVIFNTGYNATTGGQAAAGAVDQRWTVAGGFDGLNHVTTTTGPTGPSPAALPPAGTTYAPAYAGKVNNLWVSSQSGKSQWISADYVPPSNGTNQSTGYGDWYYRYQFNLDPAVDPSSFKLDMTWLADNSVAGVWVNNISQTGANLPQSPNAPYTGGGFLAGGAATTSLAGNWQTGLNTILVQVKSYYAAEGFSAEVRSTALCPQPAYTVSKAASATSMDPGGTLTYTVTVKNTGNTDYTADNPASFTDDLSQVLDDAKYNSDATGGATVTGNTLSWSGALAVGASQTITYSVTADYPDAGDGNLTNVVTPSADDGGSCDPSGTCTTVTTVTTPPAWTCAAVGYLFQTGVSGVHEINQVDLVSGVMTQTGTTTDNLNAAGYNPTDDYIYAVDATTERIVRVASDGTLIALPNPAGWTPRSYNVGDMDSNGHYWIAVSSANAAATDWYEIDYAQGSTTYGQILASGTLTGNKTGSDWTYVNGALYSVNDFTNHLVRFDTTTHTQTDLGALSGVPVSAFGAAYADASGYVYFGDNADGAIYRVDPSTMATIKVSSSQPTSGNDGARCASAPIPTITVTKTVAGRAQAADQFTVGVSNASGTVLTSATTEGTDTSASTASWPVSQNSTYTITDAMAAGSPDAMTSYAATVVCTDSSGNTVTTGGTAGAWTLTVANADAYTCDVTNGPNTPSFTVSKSASATSVQPGGTLTYTVTVTNTGTVPYTADNPASFTDDLTAVLDDATYNGDASNGATVTGSTLSWSGALAVEGSATVTYSVTVSDPDNGDHVLTNAVAPGGGGTCDPAESCETTTPVQSFSVVKTADATDVTPGDTITYTLTVTNTGQVEYTADNPASLTDDLSDVLDDATYNGDATGGATYAAPTLSWSGPLAAGATQTITYSVTVNAPPTGDEHLGNAVVTTNGGDCPAGTDNPDCRVDIPSGSFTVAKSASTTVAGPDDVVTYTVTVANTGTVDYTADKPASFADDLSNVLDDATYNGDATNGATVDASTLAWSGPLAVGDSIEIVYSVTVNDPDAGDHSLANFVRPTGPGGDCVTGECSTVTPIRTFTVSKTSSAAGNVAAGDTVTYTVTVTNTGTADYTADAPASFTDDLSKVLDDATYNGDASNGATVAGNTLSWSGALAAGASIDITYSVTVGAVGTGDGVLTNAVVPGQGGGCATADGCTTTNDLQGFTVSKTSDPSGKVNPGDTVTYTVTVVNTGHADYTTDAPASFTDDLSAVLDDATYNGDASNGATVTGNTLSWSGPLAMGATQTVTYSVTVGAAGSGDGTLTNGVVPTSPGGECTADCTTTNPVQSYTVAKTSSATQANPGDTVTYTVTVTNTGQAAYTDAAPASFTDDLTAVLDDATYNDDASNGATVTGDTLSWSGALAVGATETVTYSVTVKNPDNGDHSLVNAVTPDGPGGTCDAAGACATTTPVQSYTATKTADTNEVVPGGTITYTITLTNTGQADYTDADPATFTDDLSGVLDDATYNSDASSGATYAAPTLSWSGALPVGATVTITYSVTVNDPDTGDSVLPNAVVTGIGGNCPVGSDDPACAVVVPSGSFTVAKSASSTTVDQGGTITYTVTVTNTGAIDYTDADPASFSDDLSAVLDDATYNGDASNGATVTGTTLDWSGALAVGATTTITYSVTVNAADTGDKVLNNFVRPTSPGGECATDGGCATTTPVRALEVSKTLIVRVRHRGRR